MTRDRGVAGFLIVTISLHTTALAAESESGAYVRLGAGGAISSDATFADADCASTNPAALFGCGPGSDGRPLGAYGDFEASVLIDAGLGTWLSDWLRAEATLSYRSALGFSGDANFFNVPQNNQPVGSDVESLSLLATGYVYPASVLGLETNSVTPFFSAGIGIAHNQTSQVDYLFPTLGQGSRTTTQGGSNTDLAWSVGAGTDVGVSDKLVASFAYRYSHLGYIRTDRGDIQIVRPLTSLTIPIGETRAPLDTHEFLISLRYEFSLR